jgi:hypothetical protein
MYQPSDREILEAATDVMDGFSFKVHQAPAYMFAMQQLSLLMVDKFGRRHGRQTLTLASTIWIASPAAYRVLRRSDMVILPSERLIRSLLSKSFQDKNLGEIFRKLPPQQRLVNVLFDEVKLVEAQRFTAGHMHGLASNVEGVLAKSALVFEILCHHGGPQYILRIDPVAKLKGEQIKGMIMEVHRKIREQGGVPVSFISDNCAINRLAYKLLGGVGMVLLDGAKAFLTFDYDHIYKNIRNNWITEKTKELKFKFEGKEHTACWADIEDLYKEDCKTPLRLTKLNFTAVAPKILQRQCIDFVSRIFHDKTIAALQMSGLKQKHRFSDGTMIFIKMVSRWYKMMNVKSKFSHLRLRDDNRREWTEGCGSFTELLGICDAIETCVYHVIKDRQKKLTKYTGEAFIESTKSNIAAAKYLFEEHGFQFVLPGSVFSQSPLEIFFGLARMRNAGNFYIDIIDVQAAANAKNLHNLLKLDIVPGGEEGRKCCLCNMDPDPVDLEGISGLTLEETQALLEQKGAAAQKYIFIAGFLSRKFERAPGPDEGGAQACEFTTNLDRGGLRTPTLGMVHFVHSAVSLFERLAKPRKVCTKYFRALCSHIDSPYSSEEEATKVLANTLFKAEALHLDDREKTRGCLRRKEKLREKDMEGK